MKKRFLWLIPLLVMCVALGLKSLVARFSSGAPPYVIEDLTPPEPDEYAWLREWQRPAGPPRVGLQVGHWKNEELPEELSRLIGNTGASGGGKSEWQVNLEIAERTKTLLEAEGVLVDVLPATVPAQYWADTFIAIHADGSTDAKARGYKAAHPRRDFSGHAATLLSMIEKNYVQATGLPYDPNVTRNMRGYYAFAWWRYEHAVHPMTAAVILETGFLTNPHDRNIIVNKPQRSAEGLAKGILEFLRREGLLKQDS